MSVGDASELAVHAPVSLASRTVAAESTASESFTVTAFTVEAILQPV